MRTLDVHFEWNGLFNCLCHAIAGNGRQCVSTRNKYFFIMHCSRPMTGRYHQSIELSQQKESVEIGVDVASK